ncbi:MAG: glycosyltransferase family 4 protein [Patescibacteria group bacterium]
MRILIVTDSYPPETRSSSHLMKEMADGFKEHGHEVFVMTSRPSEHNVAVGTNVSAGVSKEDGITVIRANVLPHHNVGFVMKGISQVTLPYIFFRHIQKHIKGNIDFVWVHSPPLPLTITAELVKRDYGAKYVLNLQDFFPQNAIDLGVLKNKFLIRFFRRMEERAYKNSDIIVTPSEAHKTFANKERGVSLQKMHVVPHWIDIKPFDEAERTGKFRKLYGLENKFIFVFGGVLGPSQGLDMFIRIAEKLKKYKEIVFLFVGEGSEKKKLVELAESKKLTNVVFKPLVSKEDYPWMLKDADVGILSLTSANTTPAVPAKLMGYMAAGLPVLAFLHERSDGVKIVQDAKCGLAGRSDDEQKMLELTEKMFLEKEKLNAYGKNAFNYVLNNFTKEVCLNKIENILRMAKTS